MKIGRPVTAWVVPPLVLAAGLSLMQFNPRGWGRLLGARLFENWARLGHSTAPLIHPAFALSAEIIALAVSGAAPEWSRLESRTCAILIALRRHGWATASLKDRLLTRGAH